tara:strand:- start:6498 stop:7112 length:615 start_codon:yes stop_codon:yes gene_type:complete
MSDEIKLNIGCASRPLSGYVNIDLDTLEEIKERYPNVDIADDIEVRQYDIFNLPYEDSTVSEIRADAFLEHMSFEEEKKIFLEFKRVMKPGGTLCFSVPDFEDAVKKWLAAEDNWKDFYRSDPDAIEEKHWFGQYSYSMDNRWGYLTACIFGPQNSDGQFHKNCYTTSKIQAIMSYLDFERPEISYFNWKGDRDRMIQVKAAKK